LPKPARFTATDEQIRNAVAEAELPALLVALAHATGDITLIREEVRPPMPLAPAALPVQGGMSEAQQSLARRDAVEAIIRFRDAGAEAAPAPDTARLTELMAFIARDAGPEYLPFLLHELDLPAGIGAPSWSKHDVAPDRDFVVGIIGAGMSGLAAAYRLRQAGIPFTIFEKNEDVGGTWFENSYPGCRLDTNNFAYSYSFVQKMDWPHQFSTRDAILGYFRDVADETGLRDSVQFGTEVTEARFDDATDSWTLRHRGPDGTESVTRVNAIISAVGQLNRPNFPAIPGRDRFAGESWHTAQWRHDVELEGKRVAVIGTGASAFQVVPSIAEKVERLDIFQRNPPWMYPTPNYHDENSAGLLWLFEVVPFYHRWYRFFQFWSSVEGRRRFAAVDPEWSTPGSVSADNETMRRALIAYLQEQFSDRPDLAAKVIPNYPPAAKRMLRDNGVWAEALKRPHVDLITDGIAEITETGVRTVDGQLHEVDVIIYGTGFTASDFLTPMTVVGAGERDLHEYWQGNSQAYLGVTIPGFPNLFCLYGPNTNLVVNGSIILFSELAVDYVLECIHSLLTQGYSALDLRQDAYEEYNRVIDEANALTAWGASDVSSWYKNALGRVSQNWPLPLLDYWTKTRDLDTDAYEFRTSTAALGVAENQLARP
jgi:4-hydroxyacetophenone monooxygenase